MPYYRCQSCLLLSYSAAHHSTVGRCAHCDEPLRSAEVVESERPLAGAYDRFAGLTLVEPRRHRAH
jgi:hypothetical protein